MATTGRIATGLADLVPKLLQAEGFADVVAALARGESASIDGAWGSSSALAAAALSSGTDRTLLVVLPRSSDVDDFAADLQGFLGAAPEVFPGCRRTAASATASTVSVCACSAVSARHRRRR
jgi:transcription-repair coupling factor (superfamily II helicase)